jgi:hypothetical protein
VTTKLVELERRRQILISRAEAQREKLRTVVDDIRKPLRLIGGGLALSQILKLTPVVALGIAASRLVFRPRRIAKRPKRLGLGWLILRLLGMLGLGRRS